MTMPLTTWPASVTVPISWTFLVSAAKQFSLPAAEAAGAAAAASAVMPVAARKVLRDTRFIGDTPSSKSFFLVRLPGPAQPSSSPLVAMTF